MKRENCKDQEEEKRESVFGSSFDLEVAEREENAATEKCQQPKPRTTQAQTRQLASVCVCRVCVLGVGVCAGCVSGLPVDIRN